MENKNLSVGEACNEISCSLTTGAFSERKGTVVKQLVSKTNTIDETEDGFVFSFPYSSELLPELTEFIRVEKECCPFFNYSISITGNEETVRFGLSGPIGTKDFIKYELEIT